MYKVYGISRSRTLRVLWMLEELGLPYEHIPVVPHDPELLKVSPAGKIPVLVTPEGVLTDSVAILQYLADTNGKFTIPPGSFDRPRQVAMTLQILDELEGLIWTSARHSFILPPERRVAAVKESLRWEYARNEKAIADRLGDGPWLMGEEMTVPDFLLAHCLTWAKLAKMSSSEPRLEAWLAKVMARPAFQRAAAKG